MSEESDWEFVEDSKNDSEVVLVEMEMPPGGITSSPNVPEIVFSKPSGDMSCASSSSFSLVEKIGAVGINDSASISSFASSYAMSSASANQSIGTLISSFEVVSLSSGEVVLHCKRCRYVTTIFEKRFSSILSVSQHFFLLHSISLAILFTKSLKIFNSESVDTKGIIISTKAAFTFCFFNSTVASNIALHCIS